MGCYERIKRELDVNNYDTSKIFVDVESPANPLINYTFVDLFCGAGGMTQGLLKAGFKPGASVEVNPVASETYTRNFQECHHFCGDIETFNPKNWQGDLPSTEVHLVVGGPPCQGFSVAGKRNPEDNRNCLFQEFIRIVAEIQPWYVVMENVPGILGSISLL